jgi:hypothetical protein
MSWGCYTYNRVYWKEDWYDNSFFSGQYVSEPTVVRLRPVKGSSNKLRSFSNRNGYELKQIARPA